MIDNLPGLGDFKMAVSFTTVRKLIVSELVKGCRSGFSITIRPKIREKGFKYLQSFQRCKNISIFFIENEKKKLFISVIARIDQ